MAFADEAAPGRTLRPEETVELASAYLRGRETYPELRVAPAAFARHAARALMMMTDGARVGDLVTDDLYLPCACLLGDPAAAPAFISRYAPVIRRAVRKVCPPAAADEIEQQVVANLMVHGAKGAPEMASYAARAPLGRWVEVVAHRGALQWMRSERRKSALAVRAADEPVAGRLDSAEGQLSRRWHGGDFQRALEEALHRTTPRERVVLRLHFVEGVSVERIGKMLGISQSSASRWLASARQHILTEIKAIFRERLGISSAEVQSLAGALTSQIDLSISQALKTHERL